MRIIRLNETSRDTARTMVETIEHCFATNEVKFTPTPYINADGKTDVYIKSDGFIPHDLAFDLELDWDTIQKHVNTVDMNNHVNYSRTKPLSHEEKLKLIDLYDFGELKITQVIDPTDLVAVQVEYGGPF